MGLIRNMITKLGNWQLSQIERSQLEYKLAFPTELPDFIELKKAHQALLGRYAQTLAAATRFSFFVSGHEVYQSKRLSPTRKFIFYIISKFSPLRLLAIKPLISFFIESHMRSKLRELEVAYTQMSSTIPVYYPTQEKYLAWFKDAVKECQNLASTLSSAKIFGDFAVTLRNLFVAIVLSALGVNSLASLVVNLLRTPQINIYLASGRYVLAQIVAFFIPMVLYSVIFIDPAFTAKRDIFLGSSVPEENSVYKLENNLFDLLGRGKSIELPLDFAGLTLSLSLMLAFLYAANVAINKLAQSNTSQNVIICNIFPIFILIVIVGLVIGVIIPVYKRWHSRMI
jgi:hypothetical protein